MKKAQKNFTATWKLRIRRKNDFVSRMSNNLSPDKTCKKFIHSSVCQQLVTEYKITKKTFEMNWDFRENKKLSFQETRVIFLLINRESRSVISDITKKRALTESSSSLIVLLFSWFWSIISWLWSSKCSSRLLWTVFALEVLQKRCYRAETWTLRLEGKGDLQMSYFVWNILSLWRSDMLSSSS